jgi:hypothetical protein
LTGLSHRRRFRSDATCRADQAGRPSGIKGESLHERLDDLLRRRERERTFAVGRGRRADVAISSPALPVRPLDTGITVVRSEDLLVLTFDRRNLRIEFDEEGVQLVKAGEGAAYLVVELQPQHVVEKAYFQTSAGVGFPLGVPGDKEADNKVRIDPKSADPDITNNLDAQDDPEPLEEPPIPAYVAGGSRLVFRVPDDQLPLTFTLESLLEAIKHLELSVAANALPPRTAGPTLVQRLASPLAARSSLDVDEAQLFRPGTVSSLTRARRKARMTENRLGISTATGSASLATLGALTPRGPSAEWPGLLQRILTPEPEPPGDDETAIEMPYRLLVSPSRRGTWFHRDSPGTSAESGKTELWHTRLGARLDTGKRVEGVHAENILRAIWSLDPEMDDAIGSVVHDHFPWRMSLDAFDRVNVVHLTSNFGLDDPYGRTYVPRPLDVDLFMLSSLGAWMDTRGAWRNLPEGLSVEEWRHRATLGRDHYVRVVYAGWVFPFGLRCSLVKVTERRFHAMPSGRRAYLRQRMFLVFRELVRTYGHTGYKHAADQLDLQFPFESVLVTTGVSPDLDPPETDALQGQSCFWPHVNGKPFNFHFVATDVAGNPVDLTMPLIFVGKEINDLKSPATSLEEVVAEYSGADGGQRARVDLHGQKVAFAEPNDPDDTAFSVASLTFAGVLPDGYANIISTKPRFAPVVTGAELNIPSLQVLGGTTAASSVEYADVYLENGFEGANAGDVFLAASPGATTEVAFSKRSDRSGGFIAPDLSLSGISRLAGPVSGDLSTVSAGGFDASKYFPAALDGAKLFGAISLAELIKGTGPQGPDQLTQLPRFAGQSLNQVEQLLGDLEQLTHDLHGTAVGADVVTSIGAITSALASLPHDGDPSGVADQLGKLGPKLTTLEGDPGQLSVGPRAIVKQRLGVIGPLLDAVLAPPPDPNEPTMLARFIRGDKLPEALVARFEWRPELDPPSLLTLDPDGGLVVGVEARSKAEGPGEPEVTVTASLDNFTLNLVAVILGFEHVQFRTRPGKKPEIDVRLKGDGVGFDGPLKFVDDLRSLIPFDGFSDPPSVDVSEEGITAGFSVGLPNIAVGVLSLENLSLGAGFAVPFVGPPMSVWFRFCEREHPAQLTVMMFGGGAFFGVTMNADGLQVLEASFEFGAAISVDFGVASGGVSAMAGIYFKLEVSDAQLTGYFRLRGEVEALGIVSVCIELYLDLTYEFPTEKAIGSATISIEIDVALFSTTIEISTTKKFAGSGDDPTFAEMFDVQPDATSSDWEHYCAAFA